MAELNYPSDFQGQVALQGVCYQKHAADLASTSADSKLSVFFTMKEFDYKEDLAIGGKAKEADAEIAKHTAASRTATGERDLIFDPEWSRMGKCVQNLKDLFKPNYIELANWGIPINVSGRINYPSDFNERCKILIKFYNYHEGLLKLATPFSPLTTFLNTNNIVVDTVLKHVDAAKDKEKVSNDELKAAEQARQLRDNLWAVPNGHLRDAGNFLMGLFPGSEKTVKDWGFDVLDTVSSKKGVRHVSVKAEVTRKVNNIAIGSVLENVGDLDVKFYKGEKADGKQVVVKKGERYGLNKGCSTITVVNENNIGILNFTITKPSSNK